MNNLRIPLDIGHEKQKFLFRLVMQIVVTC